MTNYEIKEAIEQAPKSPHHLLLTLFTEHPKTIRCGDYDMDYENEKLNYCSTEEHLEEQQTDNYNIRSMTFEPISK